MLGTRIQSLMGELRSRMLHSTAKIIRKKMKDGNLELKKKSSRNIRQVV